MTSHLVLSLSLPALTPSEGHFEQLFNRLKDQQSSGVLDKPNLVCIQELLMSYHLFEIPSVSGHHADLVLADPANLDAPAILTMPLPLELLRAQTN